jgi:hypothetical protein
MKLIQELMEMAKGKSVRKKASKRRRMKKAKNPTADESRNLVAKDMQTSGAGFHGSERSKDKKGKAGRREAKKHIRSQMDY